MLPPLYRALCEASLWDDGVLEPSVSAVGCCGDESGDLMQADDGVDLILRALAFADAATGSTVGREAVKALAKQYRIDGLESRYDVEGSRGHDVSYVLEVLHDAARFLADQRASEAVPHG